MRISETVTVRREVETVWALFQDVPRLAACLPGAELTEDRGDGTYAGKVVVRLGPMTASFEGEAAVTSDPAARKGRVEGKGTDRAGGSVGQIEMEYRLREADGGTEIGVDADILLSGPAAQFGRTGLVKEMSRRLIAEFVACVEAKLEAATPEEAAEVRAAEVRGIGLFLSSLWATVVRLLRRLAGRT